MPLSACPGARCCLWLLEAPGMICDHGTGAEICPASGKEFVIIRNTLAPEPWANCTVSPYLCSFSFQCVQPSEQASPTVPRAPFLVLAWVCWAEALRDRLAVPSCGQAAQTPQPARLCISPGHTGLSWAELF